MSNVISVVEEIRAISGKGSKKAKADVLKREIGNKEFRATLQAALNPKLNYWQSDITKDPEKFGASGTRSLFGDDGVLIDLMNNLCTREVSGNAGETLLTKLFHSLVPEEQPILEMIIERRMDIGMGVGSINKIFGHGFIYDCAYMRCKGYTHKLVEKWNWGVDTIFSQLKLDGMFTNISMFPDGTITFQSRSGEDLGLYEAIPEHIKALTDMFDKIDIQAITFHGELVVHDATTGIPLNRSLSNGIINHIKQGGKFTPDQKLVIMIWDVIPFENFDQHIPYKVPYVDRFKALASSVESAALVGICETKFINSIQEGMDHFKEVLERGLEGTVIKHESLTWENSGSGAKAQLKMKNKFRVEFRICGFVEGKGKLAGKTGSVKIISECGQFESSINGIKDAVRNDIDSRQDYYLNKIVEVEMNGIHKNEDGSFGAVHPRWKELRTDRSEADTLERMLQQEQDTIFGRKAAK